MTRLPKDGSDLMLAPVALAVDQRLDELALLSAEELHHRVELDADVDSGGVSDRRAGLLRTLVYLIDMHGWTAEWHPRGVRLAHEEHALVLGLPDNLRHFLT